MAKREFYDEYWQEPNLKSAGGVSYGEGFTIAWEKKDGGCGQGARIGEVLEAIIRRIEFYEASKFSCRENMVALANLKAAAAITDHNNRDTQNYNYCDANDNPAGGYSSGPGFCISWQNGPLGKIDSEERKEPNGAFVETLIQAVSNRAQFEASLLSPTGDAKEALKYQMYLVFIQNLKNALDILNDRTERREADKTEGTHEGN